MPLRTSAATPLMIDGPSIDAPLLAGVISAAPLPLWVIGPGGVVVVANRAALAFLGYGSDDDVVGGPSHDLLHRCRPDGSDYHAHGCPIVRSQGREDSALEWFVTRQGDVRAVTWSTAPVGRAGMTVLHFTAATPGTSFPATDGGPHRPRAVTPPRRSWDGSRERAQEIIRARSSDPRFSASVLAGEMHLSARSLQVLFHGAGSSPAAEIRRVRLDHAFTMLESGHSVRAACLVSGFLDPDTFGRTFRRHFGYAPSQVRRRGVPSAG